VITLEQTAREAPKTVPVADLLAQASEQQAAAVLAIRADDKIAATNHETDALQSLRDALAKINELQDEQQQEEDQAEREKLRAEYQKLANEQRDIRKASDGLSKQGELDRRQKQDARQLGVREQALRDKAAELGGHDDIRKTMVFRHMHERIDDNAGKAADTLNQSQADGLLLRRQAAVANDLQMMADALEQMNREPDPFLGPNNEGGGGQGGGQQKPPLIPPISELRLLRNVQESIYVATRQLNDTPADALPTPQREQAAEELGAQQKELHDLGNDLLEQLQQQMGMPQQGPVPEGARPGPQPVVPEEPADERQETGELPIIIDDDD
jgi:hypothetical protein